MKKVAVYLLIFLISFVYTFESLHVLSNALGDDSVYSWLDSMETSEENTESKESKEQKEKVDFSEHFYSHTQLSPSQKGLSSSDTSHEINFPSSDYSQTIYSPPEELA